LPMAITVVPAQGQKCERCWIYSDTVGQDASHPALCKRCSDVVEKLS
jgi:isoleucyl-tRNA synthetase